MIIRLNVKLSLYSMYVFYNLYTCVRHNKSIVIDALFTHRYIHENT